MFDGPIKRWNHAVDDLELADRISRDMDIPLLVVRVLVARGMRDAASIDSYLHPGMHQLHDPFLMDGMGIAVDRVRKAVEGGEVIGIHGDYDTDGITATALMLAALGRAVPRSKLVHKLPSRFEDGYGISEDSVRDMASMGVTLLISVDCGVQAIEAVEQARGLGMDVLITDHHEPGPELPRALAILDPKLAGSSYPFKGLSGVGVAFKLSDALKRACVLDGDLGSLLYLVALGTIADMVPLLDENRPLVKEGLKMLSQGPSVGIAALMTETGIDPAKMVSSVDVSHRLAPRLNAAGRLGNPEMALELLLTDDGVDAEVFSRELSVLNFKRQAIAAKLVEEALQIAGTTGSLQRPSVVVAKEGWNPGVLGIAASRLLEETGKPSIVLTMEGDVARGSARAPDGFDLLSALESCREVLTRWGGHDRAAGLTMPSSSVARFHEALDRFIPKRYPDGLPPPSIEIDLDLLMPELDLVSVQSLEMMQPTGHGNPPATVSIRGARVSGRVRTVGDGKHLRFDLSDGQGRLGCIWFGGGRSQGELFEGMTLDICGCPEVSRWGINQEVQVRVLDVRSPSIDVGGR